MLKIFRSSITALGAAILMAASTLAQATPISYSHSASGLYHSINHGQGYTLSFNLSDVNTLFSGTTGSSYNAATDTLLSVDLTLHFSGPGNSWNNRGFKISFGTAPQPLTSTTAATVSLTGIDLSSYDIQSLVDSEGLFRIGLLADNGNPHLTGYTLTLSGERQAAPPLQQQAHPVPAPSTLALLSLGLLGTTLLGRRRSNKETHQ